jgi:hypothetical protein
MNSSSPILPDRSEAAIDYFVMRSQSAGASSLVTGSQQVVSWQT